MDCVKCTNTKCKTIQANIDAAETEWLARLDELKASFAALLQAECDHALVGKNDKELSTATNAIFGSWAKLAPLNNPWVTVKTSLIKPELEPKPVIEDGIKLKKIATTVVTTQSVVKPVEKSVAKPTPKSTIRATVLSSKNAKLMGHKKPKS
jgi:hypothetical protein